MQCAYCDAECAPTREHVIPNWYTKLTTDQQTFSARAPYTHRQGDLLVKDVCPRCNNGILGKLDEYGKILYDTFFAQPVFVGEWIQFTYDGQRLIRWLMKLAFNSSRAQNADTEVLRKYRQIILGLSPLTSQVRCWCYLVAPSVLNDAGEACAAKRADSDHPSLLRPEWFRITQFRISEHPAPDFVQRQIYINHFVFVLLVAPLDKPELNVEFENLSRLVAEMGICENPIQEECGCVELGAERDHAASSISALFYHYPIRFTGATNSMVEQALKNETKIVILFVDKQEIDEKDIESVASTLREMVATRENATAFKMRIGITVDGYNQDPRELWEIPEVREFFRRLFIECPFVMLLAHPDGEFLKLMMVCFVYEENLTLAAEADRVREFLKKAFCGLNRMVHSLVLSDEQNREICEVAKSVLFPS